MVYGEDDALQSAVHLLEGDLAAWRQARRPLEVTALATAAAKDLVGRTRELVLVDAHGRKDYTELKDRLEEELLIRARTWAS